MDIITSILLLLIIIKLFFMSEQLEQAKLLVEAANAKVDKVAADVATLHAKVDAIVDAPTAEEWSEFKQSLTDLNDKLQVVDDQTPEEEVVPPAE